MSSTPAEDVFKIPEQMQELLDEATAAYRNADRRACERWLERSKP